MVPIDGSKGSNLLKDHIYSSYPVRRFEKFRVFTLTTLFVETVSLPSLVMTRYGFDFTA
jgi:hypothetical protein